MMTLFEILNGVLEASTLPLSLFSNQEDILVLLQELNTAGNGWMGQRTEAQPPLGAGFAAGSQPCSAASLERRLCMAKGSAGLQHTSLLLGSEIDGISHQAAALMVGKFVDEANCSLT